MGRQLRQVLRVRLLRLDRQVGALLRHTPEELEQGLKERIELRERRLQARLEASQDEEERQGIRDALNQLQMDRSDLSAIDQPTKRRMYERYAPESLD